MWEAGSNTIITRYAAAKNNRFAFIPLIKESCMCWVKTIYIGGVSNSKAFIVSH